MKKKTVFKLMSFILAVAMMVNALSVPSLADVTGGVQGSGTGYEEESDTDANDVEETNLKNLLMTTSGVDSDAPNAEETETLEGSETLGDTEVLGETETLEDLDTLEDSEELDDIDELEAEEEDTEEDLEAIEEEIEEEIETEIENTKTGKLEPVVVNPDGTLTYSGVFVGDAFADVVTEDDLLEYFEGDFSEEALAGVNGGSYSSIAAVGNFLRTQMVNRQTDVTFTYAANLGGFDSFMSSIINDAESISKAKSPKEGDYITANTIGYKSSARGYGSSWAVTIQFEYTSTAAQEKEVDTKVASLVSSLELNSDTITDGKKILNIHNYLCDNIVYTSYDGLKPTYHIHGAHAALCNGKAVCQGYAAAFYRLCAEAGIGCRYIVGVYDHAWNIVQVETEEGKLWYNMDVTWDDPGGSKIYTYFLKSNKDFEAWDINPQNYELYDGHKREGGYNSKSFNKSYPMAEKSLNHTTDLNPKMFVQKSALIQKGDIVKITARNNAKGATYSAKWTTSDKTVLKLGATEKDFSTTDSVSTGNGMDIYLKGQKKGKADITLTYSNGTGTATINVQVVNYYFKEEIGKLPKGDTTELTLLDDGVPVPSEEVTWKVSKSSVASITKTNPCTVTARNIGTTTITATTKEGMQYETTVTVIPVKKITGVAFDKNNITLNRSINGEKTAELVASVVPSDTTDLKKVQYEWSVSDDSIVKLESLDSEAKGTGNGYGTSKVKLTTLSKSGYVNVTCTATAGGVTKSSTCKVAVVSNVTSVKTVNETGTAVTYSQSAPLTLHVGETKRVYLAIEPGAEKDMYIAGITENTGSLSFTDKIISEGYVDIKGEQETVNTICVCITVGGISAEQGATGSKYANVYVKVLDDGITLHNLYAKGNNNTDVIYAVVGEKLTNLYVPGDATGYRFVGWYTEPNGAGELVDANTVYTNQYDLYAYYEKESSLSNLTICVDNNKIKGANEEVGSYTFSGTAIKPSIVVFDGTMKLVLNKDYTVSYANNTNVYTLTPGDEGFYDAKGKTKAPSITIKGKGNYSGSLTEYFTINRKNVGDSDVTVDTNALIKVANNKAQKVNPTIRFAGKPLALNKDFSVDFSDTSAGAYINPGVYEVTITGNGNYTGTRIAYIRILDAKAVKQVSKLKISLSKSTFDYTGTFIKPGVTVKDGNTLLTEGVDYTLTYDNNVAAGKGQVTVHGKGLYYVDSKTLTFTIRGRNISGAKVYVDGKTTFPPIEYTGKRIYPYITLKYKVGKDMVDLVADKDYKLVYTNNLYPGTATITIIGIGAYEGKAKKTFKINPYNVDHFSTAGFRISSCSSATYSPSGAKPTIVVKFGDMINEVILTEGVDYTVTYKNNKTVVDSATLSSLPDSKKPTVLVKGKGNFKGTITADFTIEQASLKDCTINAPGVKYVDKANNWYSKVTVTDAAGAVLKEKTDYTLEYHKDSATGKTLTKTDKVDSGTWVYVVIKPVQGKDGKYLYEENVTNKAKYQVARDNNIANATIKIKDQIYTGAGTKVGENKDGTYSLDPDDISAFMKDGTELKLDADFKIVAITNNTGIGTATVTLCGNQERGYCGTKKVTFKIKQKGLWSIFS